MAGTPRQEPAWRHPKGYLGKFVFVGSILPRLIRHRDQRLLFEEMRNFLYELPDRLASSLSVVMLDFSPDSLPPRTDPSTEERVRELSDLAVLLDRRSPLGQCLRRSLTRYYFLRREGVPVEIQFGARFVGGEPDREITGHAWLTLDDRAYFEESRNWRDFTVMISFPQGIKSDEIPSS